MHRTNNETLEQVRRRRLRDEEAAALNLFFSCAREIIRPTLANIASCFICKKDVPISAYLLRL